MPRLGGGPEPRESISVVGLAEDLASHSMSFARSLFSSGRTAPVVSPKAAQVEAEAAAAVQTGGSETPKQTGRIDRVPRWSQHRPGQEQPDRRNPLRVRPIRFRGAGANGLARAYIQQSLEFRFSASKDAADFLGGQLTEQRKAVENSEAALQTFKERNGAVSVADSASNIVVARLTDLNAALTKPRPSG